MTVNRTQYPITKPGGMRPHARRRDVIIRCDAERIRWPVFLIRNLMHFKILQLNLLLHAVTCVIATAPRSIALFDTHARAYQ